MCKTTLLFALLLSLYIKRINASVCAASAGNWGNSRHLVVRATPTCGDIVVIPSGITVTITSVLDLSAYRGPMEINVYEP